MRIFGAAEGTITLEYERTRSRRPDAPAFTSSAMADGIARETWRGKVGKYR
jgi:hypothetical protein